MTRLIQRCEERLTSNSDLGDERGTIASMVALRDRLDQTSFRAAYAIGCTLDIHQDAAIAMKKPYSTARSLHL